MSPPRGRPYPMAFPSGAFSANRFMAVSKNYANQVLGTFTILLGEKHKLDISLELRIKSKYKAARFYPLLP